MLSVPSLMRSPPPLYFEISSDAAKLVPLTFPA